MSKQVVFDLIEARTICGLSLDSQEDNTISRRGMKSNIYIAQNKDRREIQQGEQKTLQGALKASQSPVEGYP